MVFDIQTVLEAYYSCRRGKRNSYYALDFESEFEKHILNLSEELITHKYTPGRSTCFVITYPTTREIFASNFRDRVVHHLLINHIESDIDKTFIYDSLACRRNKGALFGVKRLRKFLNKVTTNRTRQAYFLKLDIKSFFYNIDKDILTEILTKAINKLDYNEHDKRKLIWLSKKIIYQNPSENYTQKGSIELLKSLPPDKSLFTTKKGKGLPIGNLTSQFFANLYLNELDQYIKRELKIKYYLRYADDMLFLSNNMRELSETERKVGNFLKNKLSLELKKNKTIYGSVYQGIDFVGYYVKPNYVLARRRIVKGLKRKLYYFNKGFLIDRKLCTEEMIPLHQPPTEEDIEAIYTSINSYFGLLRWCNSFHLRQHLYQENFGIINKYLDVQENLDFFRPSKPPP